MAWRGTLGDNQKIRCRWCGNDPLYLTYHDEEWGVPERDERRLFEMLQLEGFQAGLSWITILRKRESFRAAFDGFDPEIIADYDNAKIESLLQDEGIVRHRGKIEGTVQSARAMLALRGRSIAFSDFVWQFVDGRQVNNQCKSPEEVPVATDQSKAMSKALKKEGFKFCGPTICYAFMQASGMVNDHVTDCFRYEPCCE